MCSTAVLLPAYLRQDLEQAARAHERSLGGEVRAALRQWLDDDPVLPWR